MLLIYLFLISARDQKWRSKFWKSCTNLNMLSSSGSLLVIKTYIIQLNSVQASLPFLKKVCEDLFQGHHSCLVTFFCISSTAWNLVPFKGQFLPWEKPQVISICMTRCFTKKHFTRHENGLVHCHIEAASQHSFTAVAIFFILHLSAGEKLW